MAEEPNTWFGKARKWVKDHLDVEALPMTVPEETTSISIPEQPIIDSIFIDDYTKDNDFGSEALVKILERTEEGTFEQYSERFYNFRRPFTQETTLHGVLTVGSPKNDQPAKNIIFLQSNHVLGLDMHIHPLSDDVELQIDCLCGHFNKKTYYRTVSKYDVHFTHYPNIPSEILFVVVSTAWDTYVHTENDEYVFLKKTFRSLIFLSYFRYVKFIVCEDMETFRSVSLVKLKKTQWTKLMEMVQRFRVTNNNEIRVEFFLEKFENLMIEYDIEICYL